MPFFENFIEKIKGGRPEEVVQEKEKTEEELEKELQEWTREEAEERNKLVEMQRRGIHGLRIEQEKRIKYAQDKIQDIKEKLGIAEPKDPEIE
jgi:CRISPR/Cas system CSM-associated protein Csm4 (group 5 of RAMP superfamily)